MKQDLSHITHAYLTHEGGLMFVDTKGDSFFLLDSARNKETRRFVSEKEMHLLGPQNGFLQPENLSIAFNPQHVRRVAWRKDDMLEVQGFDDKILCSINMQRYQARALLKDLEKIGNFISLPGYFCSVNADHITEICFDHSAKELAFVMKGDDDLVLKTSVNSSDASSLLKTYHDRGIPVRTSHGPTVHRKQEPAPAKNNEQNETNNKEQLSEESLKSLAARIKERVIGQDVAADSLADAVQIAFAGLKEANKPVGSFLFLGPTGVGKTEIARRLASVLGRDFCKLDMSEFMEKHSVARLIGAPPGYVGYDEGGKLTNFVKDKPYSVVLLDEVEKAHPDALKILLQVLDDGVLTDGKGNKVDFSNTIIIMTSNLGVGIEKKNAIGFTPQASKLSAVINDEAVRKNPALMGFFSPELMNRLDDVIWFEQLKPEHMKQIAVILLDELQNILNQSREKNKKPPVALNVTDSATEVLAEKGLDPVFGARPLKRVIHTDIKKPLASSLLFGALKEGGLAVIDATSDKKLNFLFTAAANNNKGGEEIPAARPEAVANAPAPQAIPS